MSKKLSQIQNRLTTLETIHTQLKKTDQQFFWLRLVTFFGGWLVGILLALFQGGTTWIWVIAVSMLAFIVVVFFHHKLDVKQTRFSKAVRWYQNQAARLTLDWKNIPLPPFTTVDHNHPFAGDLNLIGEHSLLHLIDTCFTPGGHQRLQNWLLNETPDIKTIQDRQILVSELKQLPGFRNHFILLGMSSEEKPEPWEPEKIKTWLEESTPAKKILPPLIILGSLAAVNLILLILNYLQILPPLWQISVVLYLGLYFFQHRTYASLFQDAYTLGKILSRFQGILSYLETYPFPKTGKLKNLVSLLHQKGQSPSSIIKKTNWLISAASLQNNQILSFVINLILPWDMYFAYRLTQKKEQIKTLTPQWLDCWYEIEALTALANFAALHPHYPMPLIKSDEADPHLLETKSLGHPLIPSEQRVSNDFSLQQIGQVAIITGSNMSGKSTFLRTIGINTALALCGAPVAAESFTIKPLRLFTCIQVSDSLNDGFSYFYAEVHRLKQLLDALRQSALPPVLFLVDEIFRGTNNQERRTGSQAYVKAVVQANGAGIISTHDLELSKLADNTHIFNYNFRDDVINGKMAFDYTLRPGPSPTTNALKIMALEGLPVDGQ